MFLAAVAGSRFDSYNNKWFDGIRPLIKIEPAKRHGRNRSRDINVSTPVVFDEYRKPV